MHINVYSILVLVKIVSLQHTPPSYMCMGFTYMEWSSPKDSLLNLEIMKLSSFLLQFIPVYLWH